MTTLRRWLPLLIIGAASCTPVPVHRAIEVRDLAFGPATIEASVGDTLIWTNQDLFPHTATVGGAAGWDTGPIASGATGSAVVRRAGEFHYLCQVHPTMQGTVIVRRSSGGRDRWPGWGIFQMSRPPTFWTADVPLRIPLAERRCGALPGPGAAGRALRSRAVAR